MARITVTEVMAKLQDHIDKCERANVKAAKTSAELAADVAFFRNWLNGVLDWWKRFKRWVWSGIGAVLLAVIASSTGSFWNSWQAQKAAQVPPVVQAKRDAREQAILIELATIKKELGGP